jgi:hypothetical protein
MNHFEVMEDMKWNDFPFGINYKIKTGCELQIWEETRF